MSLKDVNDGAEKDETAVNMDDNKRENFAMGLLSVRWDNTAMMMDALAPLLTCCAPPCRALPPQQDDRTAGAKIAAASASTVDKFGILADAMVSRGALTNALQGRGHNNIDNDKDDGNQC